MSGLGGVYFSRSSSGIFPISDGQQQRWKECNKNLNDGRLDIATISAWSITDPSLQAQALGLVSAAYIEKGLTQLGISLLSQINNGHYQYIAFTHALEKLEGVVVDDLFIEKAIEMVKKQPELELLANPSFALLCNRLIELGQIDRGIALFKDSLNRDKHCFVICEKLIAKGFLSNLAEVLPSSRLFLTPDNFQEAFPPLE